MKRFENDFLDFLTETSQKKNMDSLSSKLIAILYIEPREVSIEELAKRTGYSLASI